MICIRRNGLVVMAADGQVTLGETVLKRSARKIRRLYQDKILAGFAGSTADAFSLFARFETKLEQYAGNLNRAAVELAKDWLIHRLTYRRHNHDNLHVRGYKEEGTTTTPFDMCVLNNIDRFQLALDAIKRVPRMAAKADAAEQWYSEAIQRHKLYVAENGDDLPEIRDWRWPQS